jgi:phosphoglycerate dehydrogenase-like enzyme
VTLLDWDVKPNPACEAIGMKHVELPELLTAADIVSLHVPLLPATTTRSATPRSASPLRRSSSW